jgi:RNA polymerase sigma-70 factor (ECF subfamily)
MDAREFKQRYMPHHQVLYRVAYHLTGNEQDAEDLLQDLYLKLWQKRDDLPDEAMRDAYLVTMMRNLFVDQRRLKRLDASAELKNGDDPPDERSLDHQIDARDEVRQLEGLIRELSERDRKTMAYGPVDRLCDRRFYLDCL